MEAICLPKDGCEVILRDASPSSLVMLERDVAETSALFGEESRTETNLSRSCSLAEFLVGGYASRGGGSSETPDTCLRYPLPDCEEEALEKEVLELEAVAAAAALEPQVLAQDAKATSQLSSPSCHRVPTAHPLSIFEISPRDLGSRAVRPSSHRGVLMYEGEEPPEQMRQLLNEPERCYISLHTEGDGACGVHAVFGRPNDGCFQCGEGVRSVVAAHFAEYIGQIQSGRRQGSAHYVQVRETWWSEFCVPVAKHQHASRSGRSRSSTFQSKVFPE